MSSAPERIEELRDLERLLAGVRLRDEEVVDVDADPSRVRGVHRVLRVDERADAAAALGLGHHVVDERRLPRGLRAEDLDDAATGKAADAECEVEREGAGRDRSDRDLGSVAHAHNGSFAELPLDLAERDVERFLSLHAVNLPARLRPLSRPSGNDSSTSYRAPVRRRRERKAAAPDGANGSISGSGGREPWALTEAHERDVRKPRPLLALVHAEPLEPLVNALGEPRRLARRIVEDEHADGAGLAVADRRERERRSTRQRTRAARRRSPEAPMPAASRERRA